MAKRIPALAKLTTPRLHAVLCRERLLTLLKDKCDHYPLIWVSGPPGSGKTSLIASYLTTRKHRTLWYSLDLGDADPATFFHYLAKAAQSAAGRKRLQLPALTPEFLGDVPGFTRRFFRQLWSNIKIPCVLVLDNYQEVPADALLHQILPVALSEFPADANLMAISREQPLKHFAREVTHNLVGRITWDDLRFTLEETALLASSRLDVEPEAAQVLHAKTSGWVAGTMLMLERLKAKGIWRTSLEAETMTAAAFHYFAEEVFSRATPSVQEVLLRTGLLPWVTVQMAEEVSDNPSAYYVLKNYYARGLFVDRRAGELVAYQYHDLFREFLLDRGRTFYGEERLTQIKRLAAVVAEEGGQLDTSARLYAETKSWDSLSQLICRVSEKLLAQGRYQTLQGYISLLPQDKRQQHPWLLYWSGMSRLVFDPLAARNDLEQAYHQFERNENELEGLLLACSGIIESYHCTVDDMGPTIRWGDRLQRILEQRKGFPSLDIEAQVLANLNGLIYACPHHPFLLHLENSVDRIIHSSAPLGARLGVAAAFINLPLWRGDFRRVRQILDNLNAYLQGAGLPPLPLLIWRVMEANYAWNIGNRTQAKEKLQEAFIIAEEFGIDVFKPMVWGIRTYNALAAGDHREGKVFVDFLNSVPFHDQRLALGQVSFYRAGLSFINGDFKSAYDHALSALNTTAPLCLPFITGNIRVGLAKVLVELKEREKAQEQLDVALENARSIGSRTMEVHCLLTTAQLLLKEGQQQEANAVLGAGLQVARELDYGTLDYWLRPKVMGELLAHALEANIEVEYVRSVIRRRGLRPPSGEVNHWPYAVKISTLGRFELVIDDVPLTTSGKAQRKPLELLKYLCAAGPHGANQELIEEVLWSEADGEAADQAFRTTLHRLRKLLRHDEAIQLSDRHVSLDPSLVSIDYMSFERMARSVDHTDVAAIEQALSRYGGHFLLGETASWALPVREQLRGLFLNLTERLGALLEERGEVNEAAQKYLHALDVEPVAEVMCRRVMLTYVRLGRRSEAIGIYQRFSQALHAKLGVAPTPETISLYHTIL